MVKGTHKQMVVMKTGDSRYYAEAYFVLREGALRAGEAETSMMAEANRILDECMLMPQPRSRRRRLPRWATFAIGALCGAAAVAVLALLI